MFILVSSMITICSMIIHYVYASSISKARFPSNLLNRFQNKIHKILFNKNDHEYIQNNDIMNLMIGKYDNQYQMYMNQKNGKFNSKDGGHEYVNVLIKQHPIESNVLIAAYYLIFIITVLLLVLQIIIYPFDFVIINSSIIIRIILIVIMMIVVVI